MSLVENIKLHIHSAPAASPQGASLCGVVGSGNLEILFQQGDAPEYGVFEINTSANGFAATWESVAQAFAESYAIGGLRITINDMGATPAVVTLRLGQGLAMYLGVK